MSDPVLTKITNSPKRKSLFHFTRVRNLLSMVQQDALYSSHQADPAWSNGRREVRREIHFHGQVYIANAHLRIADQMMAANTTHQQFYHYLDQHVFFWPTYRDCLKMLEMYSKREPQEAFAILQLDAYSLLFDYHNRVKLSKYDSGSSPRYANRCSYKKSLQMFLPLEQFEMVRENDVPTKPSEIREVLVEEKVTNLSRYLQAVYCNEMKEIPDGWRMYAQSLQDFKKGELMK
ncbi:DUF7002 family protein [Paenibacillus cremeus]|uniref:DUF4433 domain-containing protein n=1 Tax=Paenibacillus cremeus TaxID=2163881 RepID=A0A559KGW0_9BACL|nr:hypothetical protein [Paenibacillus cremeus]TVY11351.1 hypothetical protein FPZ49_03735 [Paenibacillus cremeus]